jgi:AcrR family transcriptional regulator
MEKSTKVRLIDAAAALIDAGGTRAVTLRAVAQAVGVSHNAPYKHYKDRDAILSAVAERDFHTLEALFDRALRDSPEPEIALRHAIADYIAYGRSHPGRYRLLFSDPEMVVAGGALEGAAMRALKSLTALVEAFQVTGRAAHLPTQQLTALLYATLHGLVDIELGQRARPEKGMGDITAVADLLIELLRPAECLKQSS